MTVASRIRWLRADEGGRPLPPPGPAYSTVARFEGQTEEGWLKEAWSLILELEGEPDQDLTQVAKTRFLSEEGPEDWLISNKKFALYEGFRKVAEGVVLGDS